MKVGGSVFLWTLVGYLFFCRFAKNWNADNSYRRIDRLPDAEIVGTAESGLTFEDVTREFEHTPAAREPR